MGITTLHYRRLAPSFISFTILITLSILYLNRDPISANSHSTSLELRPAQVSVLRIIDKDKRPNPVVNERGTIALSVVDANGQPVSGDLTFESGSPDVATVDPRTGVVAGKERGFTTITVRRGNDSASAFVCVTRITSSGGANVPGDTKADTGGRVYISDPNSNVILRKDSFTTVANLFAGRRDQKGILDGKREEEALFAGPTAVAVDNSAKGGIYVADTLNHSIRKIGYDDKVETVLGTGSPGMSVKDVTPFGEVMLKGVRGIAADAGGSLFIADTENHAIYVADLEKKMMRLLAGQPGIPGKADEIGRSARFTRPAGIAISSDGRSIAVADTGNNRVRLITRDGKVSTIGRASGSNIVAASDIWTTDQQTDEFAFDSPQSVSIDGAGNIYVVDNSGVQIVTRSEGRTSQLVSLAQSGTFGKAASVVINGTRAIVLDEKATSENQAVVEVTVGSPEILNLSRNQDGLRGGAEVVVTGKNFAPESIVLLGDAVVANAIVESATQIRFFVPSQNIPGNRTLSIQTRGGVAQTAFSVRGKSLSELADGEITTLVGGIPFIGDSGLGINASLSFPTAVSVDGAGNVFIIDFINNRVRRLSPSGVITTIAGNGAPGFSGDGGPAISASLNFPADVAVDGGGNIFIADDFNCRIRRIDAITGIITTVAGNGIPGFSGDGGPATNARLAFPTAVRVDREGNLIIGEPGNNRIRRVDSKTGIITTFAGNGSQNFSGDGGPATNAGLKSSGILLDAEGNLILSDRVNHRIRRVDAKTGIITTIVGSGTPGFSGDGGPALAARLNNPTGIGRDGSGNLYIADRGNNRIRKVDTNGIITTFAGNGNFAFNGDGIPATSAGFAPIDVAVDGSGNVYIADFNNSRIRRVSPSGIINTIAGIPDVTRAGDGGPAGAAKLILSRSVATDISGNLFIADDFNTRIRRVDKNTGIITTAAGNGNFGFSGNGGSATDATLFQPFEVALDRAGNIFIADLNNLIRRVDRSGIITTFAGNGGVGFSGDGGQARNANLSFPRGLASDSAGNLFIADRDNNRIRRVDASTGVITTVAGNGRASFGGDGGSAVSAGLNLPSGVFVDAAGNLFIADSGNNRIRRVNTSGIITTIAGNGSSALSGDGGQATSAGISFPRTVIADSAGNIFIADSGNDCIRRIDGSGIITTIAGNGMEGFSGDDGPATGARLRFPEGLAIDAGNLIIADTFNNAVRVVKGVVKGQGGQGNVNIMSAVFSKPNLIINGTGFGLSGARVNINGNDVSSTIVSQGDTVITLKGNKKKLSLKRGQNQIVVTAGGQSSNTFIFNF
jgi:sugar lactone lactonase YvrE